MAEKMFRDIDLVLPSMPIRTVGIIYATSTVMERGREAEKVADCEVVEVAHAVQDSLSEMGYQAELVDLDPDRIAELKRFDWVFNLAESISGYPLADNEVARRMEMENIPFTGAGSGTLKACLDKVVTKCHLLLNGIGTPAFEVFLPGDPILNLLEYPLIVKPASEDGSIGITNDSIVRDAAELESQVRKIHQIYRQAALVEQYIEGRDITVSVLGSGQNARVLPFSETTYPAEKGPKFLTFQAKWIPDSLDYQETPVHCPCVLEPDLDQKMKDIALRACQVMGCRDYTRVDFRLRGRQAFVLEVNPNPCINPDGSGFVRAANASGLSYTDMIAQILASSVQDRFSIPQAIPLEVSYAGFIKESGNPGSRTAAADPGLYSSL